MEINAAPGFRMHQAPSEGTPRDVGALVMDMLFPPGTPVRPPIAAITGTNGKTTTTRMVSHIMRQTGRTVGMTTTDAIYVNDDTVQRGDMTGPWSSRVVLRDPTVEVAVLEVARGGIIREGLGFFVSDVGCVLNVQPDHLGIGGVQTVEALARVKRVVVETVRRDGWAVLNADNEHTRAMRQHTQAQVCWFTLNADDPMVREHIAAGGRALVLEDEGGGESLVLYDAGSREPIIAARDVPAAYQGHARFNVANALAAAGVTLGLGVDVATVRRGLETFVTSFETAPGRMNVYDKLPFTVIVDYAHNPPALEAMGDFVRRMTVSGRRIAVVSTPGDRRDEDARLMGRLSAEIFDHVIFRDDDRRKRAPGEMPALMLEGAQRAGKSADVVLDWQEATRRALAGAQPGDLVVLFSEDIEGTWAMVQGTKPEG